jgi:aminomethyltransferase
MTVARRPTRIRSPFDNLAARSDDRPALMSTTDLFRTPLHDWHVAHGGRMVDFAGWSMPVQYSSIAEEHNATRNAVGVFDISHMGRLQFFGSDTASFLDSIVTRRATDMKPGQVRYALVCNEDGGILDDVLVYRRSAESAADAGSPPHQLVVNASNREKFVDWIRKRGQHGVELRDVTKQTSMIAVQGPAAVALVDSIVECDLRGMRYYSVTSSSFRGIPVLISRTGYTGEDGCEIVCNNEHATTIWATVLDEGKSAGARPVGLGARDTLRLEAAMPLYGHELSEAINPIQAGLSFAVSLGDRDFIGRDAIEKFANDKSQPVRVGLQVDGKRVARQGSAVLQSNEIVGEVTSGTFSPTFERAIAMAYVRPTAQAVGTHLAVDIRGTQHAATVVPLPFYERGTKGQ